MLSIQFLIIVSSIIQHIVGIVLVGFVLTGSIACYLHTHHHTHHRFLLRDRFLLLVAAFIFTAWGIIEYFVGSDSITYHFLLHWAVLVSIPVVLTHLTFLRRVRHLKQLFVALIFFIAASIFLDIAYLFVAHVPFESLLRALINVAGVCIMYFFVVLSEIYMDTPEYDKHVTSASSWKLKNYIKTLFLFAVVFGAVGVLYSVVRMHPRNIEAIHNDFTVRLKWIPQAQFAGMYIADTKGYYKNEGLNASILSFDYEHYPIDDVVSGHGTFGIAGADEVLQARSEGKRVVAIATIYHKTPLVMYTTASSSIHGLSDIKNKRVGIQVGVQSEVTADVLLKKGGVLKKDITVVPIYTYNGESLIDGTVDILTGYAFNEPLQLEGHGIPTRIFNPSDYGYDMYGDVLFTLEDLIHTDPELVRRFVKATLNGWDYAISNPEEAVATTLLYDDGRNTDMNTDFQRRFFDAQVPYLRPTPDIRLGSVNPRVWEEMYQTLQSYGVLKSRFDVRDAYTTEFLPKE